MSWLIWVLLPAFVQLVVSELIVLAADWTIIEGMSIGGALDSAACTLIAAVIVLPFAIFWYRRDEKTRKDAVPGGMRFFGIALLCLLGGAVLNVLFSALMDLMQIGRYFSNLTQEALLTSRLWVQILGPGLLVPVCEELIYRGLTYRRMRTRLKVWQAVLLSSLLFALIHGNVIQMLYAFPMAIILALLMEYGRSPAFPVLFHIGANLAAIFASLLFG